MTPKELVEQFYDYLVQKNEAWSTLFSENMTFADAGMNINQAGKQNVINSFNQFLRSVEDIRVRQVIADNENVCAIVRYDYINSERDKLTQDVAEIWQVKEGKLNSLIIYFDITVFRQFMGH